MARSSLILEQGGGGPSTAASLCTYVIFYYKRLDIPSMCFQSYLNIVCRMCVSIAFKNRLWCCRGCCVLAVAFSTRCNNLLSMCNVVSPHSGEDPGGWCTWNLPCRFQRCSVKFLKFCIVERLPAKDDSDI